MGCHRETSRSAPLLPSRPGVAGSSWAALHRVLTSSRFSRTGGETAALWALPWARGGSTYLCSTPSHSRCQTGKPGLAAAGQVDSSIHTHGCQAPGLSSRASTRTWEPRSWVSLGAGERAQGPSLGRRMSLTHSHTYAHTYTRTHAVTQSCTHTDSRSHCAHTHTPSHTRRLSYAHT